MSALDRRRLLQAGAAATLADADGLRSASLAHAGAVIAGSVRVVSDRAALLRLPAVAGDVVYLAEPGRAGLFQAEGGEAPDRDPLGGLVLPGAGVHFRRLWDGVTGRPEWFGAVPNDPRQDCAAAIEAAHALCPVTELAAADYHIHRTLRLDRSWRTVRGQGGYAPATGQGTRIVWPASAPGGGVSDLIHAGTDRHPGAEAELVTEMHLAGLTLVREAPCHPHPSGDIARYPAGLRATFLLRATVRDVCALESSVGFHIAGVTYTRFDDCFARRLRPGSGAGVDRWVGYFLDGHVSYGYAGGNASVYIQRCLVADQHPAHVNPTGLLARGAFVDSFIDHFESARIATGMAFAVDGMRGYGQTIDLHIRNPVIDGCTTGIDVDLDATSSASIEIIDPYIAGGGGAGITVHDGAGLTTVTGGQIHGDFARGSILLNRTFGVRVAGTKIHNASRPIVVGEASGLTLEPQILNDQHPSLHFAVDCATLMRSVLRPTILGAAGPAFAGGVRLGGGTRSCEIGTTGIDPSCLTAGASGALWFGNADVRTPAAKAAFAAGGNVQTGVLP